MMSKDNSDIMDNNYDEENEELVRIDEEDEFEYYNKRF